MTTGALIFAFDNEHIDYLAMAAWSAPRIKNYLDLPTAVVTDAPDRAQQLGCFDAVITAPAETGGSRWFDDYNQNVTWYNASRVNAYALTPWDKTLVLDADYVICSSSLNSVISADQDFQCFKHAYDVSRPDQFLLEKFGRTALPMHWATVMMFRKSVQAQWIFDSMTMIRANWTHYRDLYGIGEQNYRNDYALSIALALVNGGSSSVTGIPWAMPSVLPSSSLLVHQEQDSDFWTVISKGIDSQSRSMGFTGIDFHAMGKKNLGDIIAARTGLPDSCSKSVSQ